MKVLVNVLGVEVILKREVFVAPVSPVMRDVVKCIKEQVGEAVGRFLSGDCTIADCSSILVNGRNILSLQGWETPVKEGDEITFLVPVAGG